MPGGPRDSSKTRVRPVFDQLRDRRDRWIGTLLGLMQGGSGSDHGLQDIDLSFLRGAWEPSEAGLAPPVSLLSWLIKNIDSAQARADPDRRRQLLGERDPDCTEAALRALLHPAETTRPWYVFEGLTYPDVLLETPDALVVIEGKRTEREPTIRAKWMAGRHQIWRHIDAAWEIRGARRVFGCFIVQGGSRENDVAVPERWRKAFRDAITPSTLGSSFPHRTEAERAEIAKCFIGGTTWQATCQAFGLNYYALPETTRDLES